VTRTPFHQVNLISFHFRQLFVYNTGMPVGNPSTSRQLVSTSGASSTAVNSFGTFLETVQRESRTNQGQPDVPALLLRIVAEHGAMPIAELVGSTGLGLVAILQALDVLKSFGLVSLVGEAGDQKIEATRSGARTAVAIR